MSAPRTLMVLFSSFLLVAACGSATGGASEAGATATGEPSAAARQAADTTSTDSVADTEGGERASEPAADADRAAREETQGKAEQPAQESNRPGVAVFPFVSGGSYGDDAEDLDPLRVGLQQMLLTELDQNEELRIVERSVLRDIMEEQDLGATDRVQASTAARIGKLVGARYMITGVFADLYGTFRMDARIIDVETSEIVQTETVRGEREELYALLVDLADRITAGADLPPLPEAVSEARKEREIPAEAITLYSRAQVYQDRGYEDRAIQMYRRIVEEFPEMEQARAALEQLSG